VQIDYNLRNISRALVYYKQSPLEIDTFFTDASFRSRVASAVGDVSVKHFLRQFESISKEQRAQQHLALANKLSPFISNPRLRRILCANTTINIRRLIDDPSAVVLIALRKHELQDAGSLLGDLWIQAIWSAAQSRASMQKERRPKTVLILDEVHNFSENDLDDIVTFGRNFNLQLVVAHQSMAQLKPTAQEILRGNAAVRVVFRVGANDARDLATDFGPVPRGEAIEQLLRLQVGQAYATVQGRQPVPIWTPNSEPAMVANIQDYRQAALASHGRLVSEVDGEIACRSLAAQALAEPKTISGVRHRFRPRFD